VKESKSICEVCNKNESIGVAAVPMVPISVAFCKECMDVNAYPWWVLVANTAIIGGYEKCCKQWQEMVRDTCIHLGRDIQLFHEEVKEKIAILSLAMDKEKSRTDVEVQKEE